MRGIDISSIGEDGPPVAEFVFFGGIEEQLVGVPALSLTAAAPNIPGFIPPEITRLYGRCYSLVSGSRGSLQRTSASFQVDAFTVLPATLPAPLVPPVANKAARQLGTISHPGASSSASPATKLPVLPEAASSMAEGNVLLTPTPALVSSDILIEEIAPAALAAPEVTKPVAMSADANQHTPDHALPVIHPGPGSSAQPATEQSALTETVSSMAQSSALSAPAPALTSSDALVNQPGLTTPPPTELTKRKHGLAVSAGTKRHGPDLALTGPDSEEDISDLEQRQKPSVVRKLNIDDAGKK